MDNEDQAQLSQEYIARLQMLSQAEIGLVHLGVVLADNTGELNAYAANQNQLALDNHRAVIASQQELLGSR